AVGRADHSVRHLQPLLPGRAGSRTPDAAEACDRSWASERSATGWQKAHRRGPLEGARVSARTPRERWLRRATIISAVLAALSYAGGPIACATTKRVEMRKVRTPL